MSLFFRLIFIGQNYFEQERPVVKARLNTVKEKLKFAEMS